MRRDSRRWVWLGALVAESGSVSRRCSRSPPRSGSRACATGFRFRSSTPTRNRSCRARGSSSTAAGSIPGWYDYPSLLFLLLAPFQAFADAPSYGAGRGVAAGLGLIGVAAAWWLGRASYGLLAGLVAGAAVAVATVHVAYSHVAVTDVLLTVLVSVSLALAVHGRLEWAGAAAGLAASAKYPGVFLAAPILAVGWGQWRRLATGAAVAALAFLLTSPFVVWHAGAAWEDISRVQRLAAEGWLGFEHDHPTPLAFLDRLWESLGPALARRARRARARRTSACVETTHKLSAHRADVVLVSFALVYFAYLLTLDAHFDRYVLPLVPVLGALAGRARPLAVVTLALLLVPLAWSIADVRELRGTDTRLVAHDWIEANVSRSATVAVDPSTPPVAAARVVRLELPGPGRPADPERDVARLRVARCRLRARHRSRGRPGERGEGALPTGGAFLRRARRRRGEAPARRAGR